MRQTEWGRYSGIGLLLVALGASMWGTDALLRKPLADSMSAPSVVFAEHLFLSLYAVPVLIAARGFFKRLTLGGWLGIIVIAWGGSAIATVLFTRAFAVGNPTTVILLQKLQPLIVVLLAAVILKERLPRIYWPCFVLAAFGAYLVSFGTLQPFWELGSAQITAALLAVAAAGLWGASTVMGRFLLADAAFSTVTAARFFFALPLLALLAAWDGSFGATFTGIGHNPGRIVLLALIPGLVGMLIYYRGLSRAPASYATLAELAYPATAAIVNWAFLDYTINATQVLGFAILWGAIVVLTWVPAARPLHRDVAVATR